VHRNPKQPICGWVEKLVRRGPCAYFIVGKKRDGSPVEIRLSRASFHIEACT
jgi:hypothetical protein